MLIFDNRPPQSPEDVHLSEAGRAFFHNFVDDTLYSRAGVIMLGQAALTEVIDAFGTSTIDRILVGGITDRVGSEILACSPADHSLSQSVTDGMRKAFSLLPDEGVEV